MTYFDVLRIVTLKNHLMLLVIRFQVAVRQTYLCACLSNFYQFWYSLIKLATEKYVELKRILTLIVRVDVDP